MRREYVGIAPSLYLTALLFLPGISLASIAAPASRRKNPIRASGFLFQPSWVIRLVPVCHGLPR
jgi:hypothetical protein